MLCYSQQAGKDAVQKSCVEQINSYTSISFFKCKYTMKFSAMNKTAMPNLETLKEMPLNPGTKQGYSSSRYLPENTSTKYRGSFTRRSPHIKRNICKLPVSVGMSVTNNLKSLNADKKAEHSKLFHEWAHEVVKAVIGWILKNSHYCSLCFLLSHQSSNQLSEELNHAHHFIGHRSLFPEAENVQDLEKWPVDGILDHQNPALTDKATIQISVFLHFTTHKKKKNYIHIITQHLLQGYCEV